MHVLVYRVDNRITVLSNCQTEMSVSQYCRSLQVMELEISSLTIIYAQGVYSIPTILSFKLSIHLSRTHASFQDRRETMLSLLKVERLKACDSRYSIFSYRMNFNLLVMHPLMTRWRVETGLLESGQTEESPWSKAYQRCNALDIAYIDRSTMVTQITFWEYILLSSRV